MKKRICFFEPDEALAGRLIDYWLGHGLHSYYISYYSDAERWLKDYRSISADLWILDRSLQQLVDKLPTGRILWWTDQVEDREAVFKYRSAAVLLHTLQGYLEAERASSGVGLISLYSPVKHGTQTAFGITISHILSTQKRILYLNLEGYSGLDRVLSDSYSKDISDFIYYINQDIHQTSNDIPLIIQKFIRRLGEVDMIPPVLNPVNLQEITEDMWLHALDLLQGSGLYDYIIIDISDFVRGIFAVLRESRVIYSLNSQAGRDEAKWQQYCSVLDKLGYGEILDRTRTPVIPELAIGNLGAEDCRRGPLAELAEQEVCAAGLLSGS